MSFTSSIVIHNTKKWFNLFYNRYISQSILWVFILIFTGFALLTAIITFQTEMARAYKEVEEPHDEPYNPLFHGSLNGIAVFIYVVLLSGLVLWATQEFSIRQAVIFFSVTLLGIFLLDAGIVFYYPLRLLTKCSLNDFDGIMRNCRNEFSDILMIIRLGGTPLILIILGVLHGILAAFSVAITVSVILKKKRDTYSVNGRGNGLGSIRSQRNKE